MHLISEVSNGKNNFIIDTLDAKNSNGYDASHIWKHYGQATQKLWYDGTGKFVPFENF